VLHWTNVIVIIFIHNHIASSFLIPFWSCHSSLSLVATRFSILTDHSCFQSLFLFPVEVFGTPGINKPVGKCGGVSCGRNVTCCLVLPSREPSELDAAYRRATWADAHNADILRQYESFAPEFDKVREARAKSVRQVAEIVSRFTSSVSLLPISELLHTSL